MPECLPAQEKHIVGWIERVKIYPGRGGEGLSLKAKLLSIIGIEDSKVGEKGLSLKAKLDTGARSSAMHAFNIAKFKRNGKDWVKFIVKNKKKGNVTIEKEVYRTVKIKRKNEKPEERLVILLGICLGSTYKVGEVSLVDRSNFIYPVLLGRRFLQGSFIIDPGKTFTHKPFCKGISEK